MRRQTGFTLSAAKRSQGFTLIEILVGLTITALIFGSGYAAYREFVRREALNNAQSELIANLNLTKQRALSGEKPQGCSTTQVFDGYQVVFSNDKYTVSAKCAEAFILIREIKMSQGLTVSGPTILYKPLGQGTNLSGDASMVIKQSGTGKTITTVVGKGGSVK